MASAFSFTSSTFWAFSALLRGVTLRLSTGDAEADRSDRQEPQNQHNGDSRLEFITSMALSTPSVRAVTLSETAAFPHRLAALIVEDATEAGTADTL